MTLELTKSQATTPHPDQGQIAIRQSPTVPQFVGKLRGITKRAHGQSRHRVLVVDDSVLPRVAARTMLATMSELAFCGEAASGSEALQIVAALHPDLVWMDVQMPGMDGPATTKALLSSFPDIKVVAWTVSESSDDLVRMMQAGCCGYILKDSGPAELQRALTAAIKSENPLPRRMMPEVIRRITEQTPPAPALLAEVGLTARELQILKGISKGHTTKRLAGDLGLAAPSVESHLQNIFGS